MKNMVYKKFNIEGFLYFLAFCIALFLRLYRLGDFPLNENEANLALRALGDLSSTYTQASPFTGYTIFTGPLFSFFGTSNFCARLIPALGGSLLVLAPVLYKGVFGTIPALILAIGLALDPSMVALSRSAGTGSLALTFVILFFGFLLARKPMTAGISLAVAFLGGTDFWYGIVIVLAGWGLQKLLIRPFDSQLTENEDILRQIFQKEFFISFITTLGLVGSGFFARPEGFGGILSSLSQYLGGWNPIEPGTTPGHMVVSLVSYELLPIVFGLIGLYQIGISQDKKIWIVPFLFISGILISLIYPAREGIHLAWSVVPLWVLASLGIKKCLYLLSRQNRAVYIYTGLICVLFFFMALNLIGLSSQDPNSGDFQLRLAIIGGATIVLGLLVTLLVWGWSPGLGFSSFFSAVMILLIINNFSAGWRSAHLGANPYTELWFQEPTLVDADLLEETVRQMSGLNTGDQNESSIAVMEPVPGTVKWILRNQIGAEYLILIDSSAAPDMVITHDANLPPLADSYTGQDFSVINPTSLSFTQPMTWLNWLLYRKIEPEKSPIFLWVKSDIFPGDISEISE